MSNTKVLNCSSIRQPPMSVRSVGDYSLRQTTLNQQGSIRSKVMQVEAVTEKSTATQRVKEIKKLNANTLSPLHSPQLIRSTRACKVVESNGWNSSVKFKSSCSSGSNSVESIVPKYQMTNNASALSQKRSYLNQTSTVTKLSNKTMNMRNDKMKKDEVSDKKKSQTLSAVTGKKLLKPTFPPPSPTKSFSSKFPNGLPFENEFYHYRKNHRSSVASDSNNSNNSSDEFTNNQRQSNSPYQDEFRRNPSNDALYVDFTLKSFDKFDTDDDDKLKKKVKQPISIATKAKFLLTDKNCYCEFSSSAKSSTSLPKSSNGQQVDFMTANKEPIVYVSSASIFPKCNRVVQQKNENAVEWVELLIEILSCIILSVEQRVGNIIYKSFARE